jgi:hypothetical protein
VGLDAEATAIGDALWNGEELDEGARESIVDSIASSCGMTQCSLKR